MCGYSWALTKRGTILRHNIWYGNRSEPCEGSGQPARDDPQSADE